MQERSPVLKAQIFRHKKTGRVFTLHPGESFNDFDEEPNLKLRTFVSKKTGRRFTLQPGESFDDYLEEELIQFPNGEQLVLIKEGERIVKINYIAAPISKTEVNTPAMGHAIQSAAVTLISGQAIATQLNDLPNTPLIHINGQGNFFSNSEQTWLTGLIFLGSLMGFRETWQSGKDLFFADNVNFLVVGNFVVNVLRTAVTVLFFTALFAGVALGLPYVLMATAIVSAAWSLFNCIRKGYQAYCAHQEGDIKKRNQLLKEAGLWLVSAVISGLTAGLAYILGSVAMHLKSAAAMVKDGIKNWNLPEILAGINLANTAGATFSAVKSIGYALFAFLTIGSVAKFSANATQDYKDPSRGFRLIGKSIADTFQGLKTLYNKSRVAFAIAVVPILALEVVSSVIAIAVTGLQVVLSTAIVGVAKVAAGIGSYFKNLFCSSSKVEPHKALRTTSLSTTHIQSELAANQSHNTQQTVTRNAILANVAHSRNEVANQVTGTARTVQEREALRQAVLANVADSRNQVANQVTGVTQTREQREAVRLRTIRDVEAIRKTVIHKAKAAEEQQAKADFRKLIKKVEIQMTQLKRQPAKEKIQDKLNVVSQVNHLLCEKTVAASESEKPNQSLDIEMAFIKFKENSKKGKIASRIKTILENAKKESPKAMQSFFKEVSETEEIIRTAESLDRRLNEIERTFTATDAPAAAAA